MSVEGSWRTSRGTGEDTQHRVRLFRVVRTDAQGSSDTTRLVSALGFVSYFQSTSPRTAPPDGLKVSRDTLAGPVCDRGTDP